MIRRGKRSNRILTAYMYMYCCRTDRATKEREREREGEHIVQFNIHYLTCQNYLSLFPSPFSFSRVKRGRKPPPMYQLN